MCRFYCLLLVLSSNVNSIQCGKSLKQLTFTLILISLCLLHTKRSSLVLNIKLIMRSLVLTRKLFSNSFCVQLAAPSCEHYNAREKVATTFQVRFNSTTSSSSAPSAASREDIINAILSRDKEIFELKRQHELSMLRVEEHQRRILKDQEDRGMYYEQNCNVHTFDTVSVGLHSQRSTLFHTMSLERLRNFKIFLSILTTIGSCGYIYYRYMINPEFEYVEKPMKLLGSRVQAIREMQWDRMNEEEKLTLLQRKVH